MKTIRKITLFALAALIATAGWAGDDEHEKKKCGEATDACLREMVDQLSGRGWIGIEWDDDDEIPVLTQVVPGSPAERAGLEPGDKLLAFNGVKTSEGEEAVWKEAKRSLIPGKTITLAIERSGTVKDVKVLLVELPRALMAQWIGNHVLEHHLAEKAPEAKVKAEADAPSS